MAKFMTEQIPAAFVVRFVCKSHAHARGTRLHVHERTCAGIHMCAVQQGCGLALGSVPHMAAQTSRLPAALQERVCSPLSRADAPQIFRWQDPPKTGGGP